MENNDIIVQVDESTKGIMETVQKKIQESISSEDVKERMTQIKKAEEENSENIERVITKLNGFSGMNASIEELKAMAQETQSLKDDIAPISSSIIALREENAKVVNAVEGGFEAVKQRFDDVEKLHEKISLVETKIDKLASDLQSVQTSMEKMQYSIDIIINLVTPFWKKIFKKQES